MLRKRLCASLPTHLACWCVCISAGAAPRARIIRSLRQHTHVHVLERPRTRTILLALHLLALALALLLLGAFLLVAFFLIIVLFLVVLFLLLVPFSSSSSSTHCDSAYRQTSSGFRPCSSRPSPRSIVLSSATRPRLCPRLCLLKGAAAAGQAGRRWRHSRGRGARHPQAREVQRRCEARRRRRAGDQRADCRHPARRRGPGAARGGRGAPAVSRPSPAVSRFVIPRMIRYEIVLRDGRLRRLTVCQALSQWWNTGAIKRTL